MNRRGPAPKPQRPSQRVRLAVRRVMSAFMMSKAGLEAVRTRSVVTSESTDPWACLSCDALLTPGRVPFCSEVCSEFARAVRYHRRVLADGRSGQPDVQAAVSVRMAYALWGEAPAKPLMAVTRDAVFAAKGDRCLSCGAPGSCPVEWWEMGDPSGCSAMVSPASTRTPPWPRRASPPRRGSAARASGRSRRAGRPRRRRRSSQDRDDRPRDHPGRRCLARRHTTARVHISHQANSCSRRYASRATTRSRVPTTIRSMPLLRPWNPTQR